VALLVSDVFREREKERFTGMFIELLGKPYVFIFLDMFLKKCRKKP
jgi:hypothetical protein